LTQEPGIRQISIMVDYLFGKGVSRALPKKGFRLSFSRRSGRVKLIQHEEKIFATVRPNGAFALSVYGAQILAENGRFSRNCVQVSDGVAEFVKGGKSVFCKFVEKAGENVHPKSEVAITDSRGRVLGVGTAVLDGKVMSQFKSGVAVKVRAGLKS
jgi:predicted RNA-binding protein (TIGR00451 family)